MSIKLEKIAAERDKACKKRDEWDARMKEWEQKYKEQENAEIHDMVHAADLSIEQLAEIIRMSQRAVPNRAQFMSKEEEFDEN